jgi:predicted AlkP superfamily phosphohydrolase/phosphomutase
MNGEMKKASPQLLVIGLDGGSWNLLERYIDRGLMPTLQRLMEKGSFGDLCSTMPPITAPAWTTFRTGVKPGKHGLFSWTRPAFQLAAERVVGVEQVLNSTLDIKVPSIWQTLSAAGKKVGIINLPFSYPVDEVNGVMVANLMYSSRTRSIYPPTLEAEILANTSWDHTRGYEDGLSATPEYLKQVIASVDALTELNEYLLSQEQYDLYLTVFPQTDIVQHIFFHVIDETHALHERGGYDELVELLDQFYMKIDEALFRLTASCGQDTDLLIMSDHGFQQLGRLVNVNRQLLQWGCLTLSGKTGRRTTSVVSSQNLLGTLSRLDFLNLKRYLPYVIRKRFIKGVRKALNPKLAISRSQAQFFASSDMGIYLLDRGQTYEALRDELIERLQELVDPLTGEPVFAWVARREEIFAGPYLEWAPDILMLPKAPYFLISNLGATPEVFADQVHGSNTGFHSMDGILVAGGPSFEDRGELEEFHIADLAPTILYRLGEPLPAYMDGRVLTELFRADYLEGHSIVTEQDSISPYSWEEETDEPVYSEADEEALRGHLRDLGYL